LTICKIINLQVLCFIETLAPSFCASPCVILRVIPTACRQSFSGGARVSMIEVLRRQSQAVGFDPSGRRLGPSIIWPCLKVIYYFFMDKKFIVQQKEKLEQAKKELEKQLGSFAQESNKVEGGWDAKMPLYKGGIEEEADEVEEFDTRLALEETLEEELKKVNLSLEKIKKGKYGICAKCQKPIPQGRLLAYPQAELCAKCQ